MDVLGLRVERGDMRRWDVNDACDDEMRTLESEVC